MANSTCARRAKQPTKAELQQQLVEVKAKLEKAEAKILDLEGALLDKPAPVMLSPNSTEPEALLAPKPGVMRVWIMTDTEGYRLKLSSLRAEGIGWEVIKYSNGVKYHLFQADGDDITCDCKGCEVHGPRCNGGKGCKHARMIRALRQLVDPSL